MGFVGWDNIICSNLSQLQSNKQAARHSAIVASNGLYYNQIRGRLCAESDLYKLDLLLCWLKYIRTVYFLLFYFY